MSGIRKLASQTAVYGLSTMLGRLLNYLLVPLYTGILAEVADYGVVGVMFSYASLFAVLFMFGLETAFFHFSQKSDETDRVFSTAANFLIFTGFIWIILARTFSQQIMDFVEYPTHPEYAVWFAIILAADAITSIGFARLRQNEQPWTFAIIKFGNIFINIGLNVFFLVVCPYFASKGQLWAQDLVYSRNQVSFIFIANVIASLATFVMLLKTWKTIRLGIDIDLLKRMLKYSYPLIFIGLAGMINETFDRILLKKLLPDNIADHEVSIYSAFYKLSLVLTLFVQAFRFAVEPYFFKQAKQLNPQQSYAYVMKYFIYAVTLIYLGTIAILPYIAPIFIQNPDYFADTRGMEIVPILLAANLFLGIYYTLSVWYKVSEQTKIGSLPAFAGATITLILNLFLIPKFGFVGSAYTTLFTYIVMVLAGFLLCRKYYPIPYNLKLILPLLLGCFFLGWMIQQMPSDILGVFYRSVLFFVFFGGIYLAEKKSLAKI